MNTENIKYKKTKKIRLCITIVILIGIIVISVINTLKFLFPIKYKAQVHISSIEYNLDPCLILAIIKVESDFNPQAISPKSARGLMQITESTAKWIAQKTDFKEYSIDKLHQPDINIEIGCWYFNELLNEFDENINLALAAYNAGNSNVRKWIKNGIISSSGQNIDDIPFGETKNYVKKVNRYYFIYKKLYQYSF